MRKTLIGIAAVVGLSAPSHATLIAYQTVTNTVVATTGTVVVDMSANVIDLFSAQAVVSSASPSAVTFNDGRASTASITVLSTSGVLGSYINVGGVVLTFGVDISTAGTTAALATNIAAAINANSTINPNVVSTTPAGSSVVFATSTHVGSNTNYFLFSSVPSKVSAGPNFMGGTNSAINLSDSEITVPGHGLTTAMAVLYTTGSGVTVSPLVNNTTYYVISEDANDIALALTSTGAAAGQFITLTSSSTTGPHSFTLTPLALTGTVVLTWQASNDNVNWSNLSLSSLSFGSPYTATNSIWDFGAINFKFIRAFVAGPTTGAVNLTISGYGKSYGQFNR